MKLMFIVLVVLCLFIIACDTSVTQSELSEAISEALTGEEVIMTLNFKGIVTDAKDNSPIQNANVWLRSGEYGWVKHQVLTDAEGQYSMHYHGKMDVSLGILRAYKFGYEEKEYVVKVLTQETQVFNFKLKKIN